MKGVILKFTKKQLDTMAAFAISGEPFWLSVRSSFTTSNSKTIDIERDGARVALREIRTRRYDGLEDVKSRLKEAIDIIVAEIENRFPSSPFEGVVYATESNDGK